MTKPETKPAPGRDEFQEKAETAAAMSLPAAAAPDDDDLPDDVKKQLIGYDAIELEKQLLDCISTGARGVITVDKIIVALWHRHKKVHDRAKIMRTLNDMADAGKIEKHSSPRGYSLPAEKEGA